MSDELLSALYPPPPVFYKYFTKENLEKFKTWEESVDEDGALAETALTEDGRQDEKSAEKAIEEKPVETGPESNEVENNSDEKKDTEPEKDHDRRVAPGELKFLQPPTPPPGTSYRGYGNIWSFEDKLPSLKSSNWEQLYEDDDEIITSETKIKELHKLMDSLLLNFLELISIVSINPSLFENKVKDISLILININHLLNTYRPHQSRESLIMLLKKQIEMKQLEIAQIDTVTKDITQKIINLTESIADEAIESELNTTDESQAKLDAIQRLTSD